MHLSFMRLISYHQRYRFPWFQNSDFKLDPTMNNDIVLTDGQRQVHRREQLKLSSMKKSWSTDSLNSLMGGSKTCVCAPTSHPGSFKCRYHRHQNNTNQVSHHSGASTIFEEKSDASASESTKTQPKSAKIATDGKVTFDI